MIPELLTVIIIIVGVTVTETVVITSQGEGFPAAGVHQWILGKWRTDIILRRTSKTNLAMSVLVFPVVQLREMDTRCSQGKSVMRTSPNTRLGSRETLVT